MGAITEVGLLENGQKVHKHPLMHPSSRRLHMILLMMFGYFSMALITSNIGITLSCMMNSTALAMEAAEESNDSLESLVNSSASQCSQLDGGKVVMDYGGSYNWDVRIQGYIVGATFFGGLVATIPSGLAIDHFSVRHILLCSVLLLSTSSVILPFSAHLLGPWSVVFLRFLMGLGEGMMLPGLNGMITQWIPLDEKSMAASLFTSGNQLSGIIGSPMAAEICASPLRWPAVFYVSGFIGYIWCILWYCTVNNSPVKSKWISEKEVEYLEQHVPKKANKKNIKTPWFKMLTSPAFLTVIYCSIMANMMLAFLLVYIPVYFKDVLMLDVSQNGVMSAIPHFVNLILKLSWAAVIDVLRKKKILSPTMACKLSQGISMFCISLSFISLAYLVDCSTTLLALLLLCALCGSFSFSICGWLTSFLSIAPNHVGVMSSICQIIGFGGRVATPLLISHFKTIGTAEEWRGILLVFAGMAFLSGFIFIIWGSGEIQPWNYPEEDSRVELEPLDLVDKKLLAEQNEL